MDSFNEEKIVLDQKTFKALAVDTRVEILKELSKRRKTQSEMADVLGLSVATVKEHMDKMAEAGLVKQKDEGRKWKYYDLTEKGRCLLYPERKKIWVILVSLFFVAALSLFTTFNDIYLSSVPKNPFLAEDAASQDFGNIPVQRNSNRMPSAESMPPVDNPEIAGTGGEGDDMRTLGISSIESTDESAEDSIDDGDSDIYDGDSEIESPESESNQIMPRQTLPEDVTDEVIIAKERANRFPVLQYASYAVLLFLVGLFIYHLGTHSHKRRKKL
ncbi:MAG: winged helix-turn-helix domain-containing protein [Candidatus Woesearchaeota archaeon]